MNVIHSEEVRGHQEDADHVAQDYHAVGVAELGNGDVDDERDGKEHQADDA